MRALTLTPSLTLSLALALATSSPAHAQTPPPPPTVAITHGRVFLPSRAPLDDATVVLSGGKVLAVGAGVAIPAGATTLDATGKFVTPGFIDAMSDVGVVDIELEPQTSETDVRTTMTPALRLVDGYNPDSIVIPITRAEGVTSAIVVPANGLLAGQSVFVDLAGRKVADAVVRPTLAQYAHVDEGEAQEVAGTRGGMWMMLREALEDARFYTTHRAQYDANGARQLSLRRIHLEALQPVLRGEQPLVVTAHRASDIETALRLADELKIKIILAGASEAWMLADDLARRHVPVIVDPLEDLPSRFDRLHSRADEAAILARAGVPVVISTFSAHQTRLLWQRAGNAVRFGMDHDAAIRAVTEAPADAFGLRGYGRIEAGAVGNVVVWSGDPLQTSSRVEHVFVRGREESLETRQKLLLERYRTLPLVRDGTR
jgi:imidazolonepropionase-like amidohydrolase